MLRIKVCHIFYILYFSAVYILLITLFIEQNEYYLNKNLKIKIKIKIKKVKKKKKKAS